MLHGKKDGVGGALNLTCVELCFAEEEEICQVLEKS